MSVLIKDMEKPKSCYAVIDGESEYCPFVNTDDDCVLLLKKGRCEGTWADQYSKCPLIETAEPCEVAVSAMAVEEMLKNLLPKRGMWEIEGDDAKTAICETIHDALEGLWKMPFVKPDSNKSSVTQKALDTISRQAVIDAVVSAMIDGADAELVEGIMELLPSAQPETPCYLGSPCEYQNKDIKLPSAQPERKKGRWILKEEYGSTEYMCSACHCREYLPNYNGEIEPWCYCPNCGADMRGESE